MIHKYLFPIHQLRGKCREIKSTEERNYTNVIGIVYISQTRIALGFSWCMPRFPIPPWCLFCLKTIFSTFMQTIVTIFLRATLAMIYPWKKKTLVVLTIDTELFCSKLYLLFKLFLSPFPDQHLPTIATSYHIEI